MLQRRIEGRGLKSGAGIVICAVIVMAITVGYVSNIYKMRVCFESYHSLGLKAEMDLWPKSTKDMKRNEVSICPIVPYCLIESDLSNGFEVDRRLTVHFFRMQY